MFSLKALGRKISVALPSFYGFPEILGLPWLRATSLQFLTPSSPGHLPSVLVSSVCSHDLLINIPVPGLRAHPNPDDLSFTSLTLSAKTFLLNEVTF